MSISLLLVLITVGISLYAWRNPGLQSKWIHNPYYANTNKEYYRLLSSGFIHADFLHLFFNMYALYLFGDVVVQYFTYLFGGKGTVYFLLLYLLGIVIANLPDFVKHKNHLGFNSLGASGGVSAVVFCSVILNPMMELMIFPIPLPMPGYIFAVVYMGYSIYMEKRQMDNVNHMAHLWGALWGVVFILVADPNALSRFVNQISLPF
ncbi:rhomboid family intramembrane serine protease [Marinilongibacter aquaticus]|uniref:rhomboid family intramembrane serine protease n=1 Tax=Marinilongibacter aquaticus TaxID=2975157 RepID=UPI0021BD8111|nr:rhomboid family intramembrane serine protease [Marinilongibacter aquaticus]UBM57217.1 rhomboid family intramembrane serine protease [Marinilongibacter aquaticus]